MMFCNFSVVIQTDTARQENKVTQFWPQKSEHRNSTGLPKQEYAYAKVLRDLAFSRGKTRKK